jgi:hypothetical protein
VTRNPHAVDVILRARYIGNGEDLEQIRRSGFTDGGISQNVVFEVDVLSHLLKGETEA